MFYSVHLLMFPALIQFNYQINLPEKEVAMYVAQYSATIRAGDTTVKKIDAVALQAFISSRRENLLSIQSLSELKKDTNFDIQDIKAEVTLTNVKKELVSGRSQGKDFHITLTLYLTPFIVLGQFSNDDFLISTIEHLPDFMDRKAIPVKRLHHFKSLLVNTYQLVRLS